MDLIYINEHPEEYAQKLKDDELQKLVRDLNDKYHNDGNSGISDNSFDALVHCLKKRVKESYKLIGALPRERRRSTLPYLAPSLNKVKVGTELTNFLFTEDDIVWSVKLDGVTGIVVYENGIASKVFLRGNGKVGADISYVLEHIEFPQSLDHENIVVRGEFVMDKKVWSKKYSSDPRAGNFTTSRNFICGKLNSCTATSVLKDIKFIAFDIVFIEDEHIPPPSECFEILEDIGFEVVTHESGYFVTADIVKVYSEQRKLCPYPIDGVVLALDDWRKIPNELENPSTAIAFKMQLDEQLKETEVTEIDWRVSRHGVLVPVVSFKPVYIEGRRLTKATGHNARRCIQTWKICQGTKIRVTLSGCIIPKIVEILKTGTILLEPAVKPAWKWSGCDIILEDIENNPDVKMKRLEHFFKSLNVIGIREGTLKNMNKSGLLTLQDILRADEKRLLQVFRIGAKTAPKYRKEITTKIPVAKLYRLMYGSNCFPKGMGKTFLRQITVEIPTFLTETEANLRRELLALHGIGKIRAQKFIEGLIKFKVFMIDFPTVVENNRKYFSDLAKKGYNKKINGKTFVFTTLDDDDLEDYICDHKGTLGKAVTRRTTAVITGNPLELTQKTKDAHELGIKVYTVSEFNKAYIM